MKYRIVECRGGFYPQVRILGIWFYYYDYDDCKISQTTREKSENWLKEIEKPCVIHEANI